VRATVDFGDFSSRWAIAETGDVALPPENYHMTLLFTSNLIYRASTSGMARSPDITMWPASARHCFHSCRDEQTRDDSSYHSSASMWIMVKFTTTQRLKSKLGHAEMSVNLRRTKRTIKEWC
jgi:hypothetical protein